MNGVLNTHGATDMGWARMDDGYMYHPKIVEAGPWPELLDRRAIEHCAKNETDGLVTRSALRLLGRDIPKLAERVTVLLEVGRWTANEAGGGWWVHDYLKFNPSKAEKEAMRVAGRERVRKHRSNAVTNAYQSKGRGSLEPEKQRVPSIVRCKGCGKLDLDCQCANGEPARERFEEAP